MKQIDKSIRLKIICIAKKYAFKRNLNYCDSLIFTSFNRTNCIEYIIRYNKTPFAYNILNILFRNLIIIYHQNKSIEEILLPFLKENKCDKSFIECFDKYRQNENSFYYNDLKTYCLCTKLNSLISNAFEWKNTEQGFKFWQNISFKWSELVDTMIL